SLLAVPVALAGVERANLPALAGDAVWLSGLWLAVAVMERRPGWFTAFQAAVTAAVVFAVAASLGPADFVDPDGLRRFILGLSVLSLAWMAMRLAVRDSALVNSRWPALDRVVLGGLALGQLALALSGVMPGVSHELGPAI